MQPSCLLFEAMLIVKVIYATFVSAKTDAKPEKAAGPQQIAQLKMVKTLRKGDEKHYMPKY